jgi:hypothetical protein
MDNRVFQKNRARFTRAELEKYDGQWVAFSDDGSRIVASSEDLGELDKLVTAAGEDPQKVGYECIDFQGRFADHVELYWKGEDEAPLGLPHDS